MLENLHRWHLFNLVTSITARTSRTTKCLEKIIEMYLINCRKHLHKSYMLISIYIMPWIFGLVFIKTLYSWFLIYSMSLSWSTRIQGRLIHQHLLGFDPISHSKSNMVDVSCFEPSYFFDTMTVRPTSLASSNPTTLH